MDLGSNFHAKLEPFLLIGKSMKGAAAAKLISDATSAPGVFVFSELLELPNIQEVCVHELLVLRTLNDRLQLATHEQYASHHALLQVFSSKTYEDYLR